MLAPCGSRPCAMPGTRRIRLPAKSRRSTIFQRIFDGLTAFLLKALFAPGRQDGRALEHGPFFVAGTDQREAIGWSAVPGGAKAVLRQFPGALAFVARTDRLALHLAVGRERHLEFDV